MGSLLGLGQTRKCSLGRVCDHFYFKGHVTFDNFLEHAVEILRTHVHHLVLEVVQQAGNQKNCCKNHMNALPLQPSRFLTCTNSGAIRVWHISARRFFSFSIALRWRETKRQNWWKMEEQNKKRMAAIFCCLSSLSFNFAECILGSQYVQSEVRA